jgi:hypothetical protein
VPERLEEEELEVTDVESSVYEEVEVKEFWALTALRSLVGRRQRRRSREMSKRLH